MSALAGLAGLTRPAALTITVAMTARSKHRRGVTR
jgi:hypothetical protein